MAHGIIFDVKELAVHDGPGIRATVFFKGCPLRCAWCHNPEGLSPQPQLMISTGGCTGCGRCRLSCGHPECASFDRCTKTCPGRLVRVAGTRVSAADLAVRLLRLSPLLADGGFTISGGEPLLQPEFLLALLGELAGVHTIVETSGYAPSEVFRAAAEACTMVYLDIKHADDARHRELTGVGNGPVLANLEWLKSREKPFLVRIPLIPGCNDDMVSLDRAARLLVGTKFLQRVELLACNPYAGAKYGQLGMTYPLGSLAGPSSAELNERAELFKAHGVPCVVLAQDPAGA